MITKDEIIEMARQAGWPDWEIVGMKSELKNFAKLVADVSTTKEREACAKVCEDKDAVWKKAGLWRVNHEYKECADAIRARGTNE